MIRQDHRECFPVIIGPILCVLLCSAFAYGQSILLWNGEAPFTCEYGAPDHQQAFRGEGCFRGAPDPYHEPRICLNGLDSWRSDISGYDELWFFAKCSEVGKRLEFSITAYPNESARIDISPYIPGGTLTAEYQLVRIPLMVLKTPAFSLESIENLRFGVADSPQPYSVFIDEVYAVKLGNFPKRGFPLIGALPALDLGEASLGAKTLKTVSLKNIGEAPLEVSAVTIEGDDTSSFSLQPQSFSIEPGQETAVSVTFSPDTPGPKKALFLFKHNENPWGSSTNMPIQAVSTGPAIGVSTPILSFGDAPAGQGVTRAVTLMNAGNQPLVVSSAVASDQRFQVSPSHLELPPQTQQDIAVTFTPENDRPARGFLTIESNDPLKSALTIELSGQGSNLNDKPVSMDLFVDNVSSSSLRISWPQYSNTDEIDIHIAPNPPESSAGMPPGAMWFASLAPEINHCAVDRLSAAVDVFICVNAWSGNRLVAAGFAHARTLGGPKAPLDTPLREAHMYAPNILELVLANPKVKSFSGANGVMEGYAGPQWQAGPWTVSYAEGAPLPVTKVFRHSVPVGQPYYELGYAKSTHDDLIDVDHQIFLVFDKPIANGNVLHVQGPNDLDFFLPFSDRYLETPVLQVNQVGYCPRATKRYAYVSGWMGDGGPLSLTGFPESAEVLSIPEDPLQYRYAVTETLKIASRTLEDEDAGGEVREIDLSRIPPAEGAVYRVRIPGVGVSWPAQVSETAVFKAFYTVARGLFHNRWGRDLSPAYTEWSPRPPDHATIYRAELLDPEGNPLFGYGSKALFPKSTPKDEERVMRGGHHNAGDFDIQLFDHLVPMLLMRAYELNPAAFSDGQLTIPESGNGIPDILDEALWNLMAWECLQEEDGGVRAGVESWREPWGIYFADQDPLPYWSYSRHTLHTLRIAGLFAQAARLVHTFDPGKANELTIRAGRAYAYAVAHGANQNSRGPMFYAAGELFRLTGEDQYRQMFEAAWRAEDKYGTGPGAYAFLPDASAYYEASPPIMLDHLLGYLGSPAANMDFFFEEEKKLSGLADEAARDVAQLHAHRNGRSLGPGWGRGTAVGEFVRRIYARAQLSNLTPAEWQSYFDAISLSADYVLGANPEGMVWITGLGSRHPEDPLHLDSLAFIKEGKGPVPGFAVFGPTKGISGMSYYDFGKNTLYPPFMEHPLMRRYADIHTFVINNEGGCQAAALHTELFGMLLAPGMMPPPSWLPGGAEHRNALAPAESALPQSPAQDIAGTIAGTATTVVLREMSQIEDLSAPAPDAEPSPSNIKDERLRRSLEKRPGDDGTNRYAPFRKSHQ